MWRIAFVSPGETTTIKITSVLLTKNYGDQRVKQQTMKHAFVFPGQGSQFPGMGKDHYENSAFARKLIEQANEVLEFRISDIMFNGTEEDLRQTNVTQPSVFLHSIIAYKSIDPSINSASA